LSRIYTDLDIDKLIQNCINNDRESQKQFYMLTAERLMNVSRRYTKDISDAKDILQNAYIKIFKKLENFDSEKGNLNSWLTKIVINEALQLLRKNKRLAEREQIGNQQFEELSTPEVIARLQAEDVMKLMKLLPDGYRIVFNMSVVEGYSHREIAAALNISESTSRSQLTRAKRMLRDLLNDQKTAELC